MFHADAQEPKWLYVVPMQPRKRHVFEAQDNEEAQEDIDVANASQEDEGQEYEEHEHNNGNDEDEGEESTYEANDDKDIDLMTEYENLIGIDLDIGLDTMRDVIEDEFDEESLPQNNEVE